MNMVTAYVTKGLGIGCHKEVAYAFEKAGASVEIILMNQFLSGDIDLSKAQVIDLAGGFVHGDALGSGMCAASQLRHSGMVDRLREYAEQGNVIYGQCNGFQILVKSGLLPGYDSPHQPVTLTHNDCGNYHDGFFYHAIEKAHPHFIFEGLESPLLLSCRHGEGKMVFGSEYGTVTSEEAEEHRKRINKDHVILRYCTSDLQPTDEPNGSVDGIAGLVDATGNIFGHMAHPEVCIYFSRNPDYFSKKDHWRRIGLTAEQQDGKVLRDDPLKIFENIMKHFKG